VPAGGTTGQRLQKNSATNYDTAWVNTAPVDAQNQKVINVADPTAAQDAASKNYVDLNISNLASPGVLTAYTATTEIMMGSPVLFTPKRSGRVIVIFGGGVTNNNASGGSYLRVRFGTGTPPAFGAAPSGAVAANATLIHEPVANLYVGYNLCGHAVGLSVGVQYWFMLTAYVTGAQTGTINSTNQLVFEI
jgi:hypothetical protein